MYTTMVIVMFLQHRLDERMDEHMKKLQHNPNIASWKALAEACLVRILIFNKRRSSEPARMLLSAFQKRADWQGGNAEIKASLNKIEQHLLKT